MTARPLSLAQSFHGAGGRQEWDWTDLLAFCRAVARGQTDRRDLAEDAAQEALVRAWRFRSQCQDRADPRPWLAAIVRREVHRLAAAHRHEVPVACLPDPVSECDQVGRAEERTSVERAVATLVTNDRRVLLLRYVGDMTQPQIARVLDIPEGTVKIRLHRARARLRAALQPETHPPAAIRADA